MSVEERLAALEAKLASMEAEREGATADEGTVDRRGLLRKGGAVLAGAAGIAALGARPAGALTGEAMSLGLSNDASTPTRLTQSQASNPNPILVVTDLGVAESSAYEASLAGWGDAQAGVYAYSYTGRALIAWGNQDSAVPLFIRPKNTAPSTGAHQVGELLVLQDGSLVSCVLAGTGNAAKWSRIGYNPLDPVRLVDTREGIGAPKAALGPGGEITVQVTGLAGMPAASRAVVFTLTGTQPSATTHLTAYPNGITLPGTSNLNLVKGQTLATEATVRIGTQGKIKIFNKAGTTHVLLDAVGFYI